MPQDPSDAMQAPSALTLSYLKGSILGGPELNRPFLYKSVWGSERQAYHVVGGVMLQETDSGLQELRIISSRNSIHCPKKIKFYQQLSHVEGLEL